MSKYINRHSYDIRSAFASFAEAHRFVIKHRLFRYIIGFGILFLLIFLGYILIAWQLMGSGFEMIREWHVLQNWQANFPWLKWPILIIQYTLQVIVILLLSFVYKYVVLVIGSPLFSILSEKTEELAANRKTDFSFAQLIKDIARGLQIAGRNLIRQSGFTLFFLVLSFVPVIGWLSTWIIARKDWYYYGFSMLDYSCERHRMNAKESVKFIKRHNILATINGLVFYLLLLIPILGALIAPSYCVIAATLAFLKIQENEKVQALSTTDAAVR